MSHNKRLASPLRYLDEWRTAIAGFIDKHLDTLPNGSSILDIGLGDSTFLPLKKDKGFELTVLDKMKLDFAHGKTLMVDLQDTVAVEACAREKRYDLVICSEVFEHVERPWIAAGNLLNLCKDSGTILFTVPCNLEWHPGRPHYGDYWRFMPDSVGILFPGLTVKETPYYSKQESRPFPLGILATIE